MLQFNLKLVKFFVQVQWLFLVQQLQNKIHRNIVQFNQLPCMASQSMLVKCLGLTTLKNLDWI